MNTNLQINPNAIDAHPIGRAMDNIHKLFDRHYKRFFEDGTLHAAMPTEPAPDEEAPDRIRRGHPDFRTFCSQVRAAMKRSHFSRREACLRYGVDFADFVAEQRHYYARKRQRQSLAPASHE